MTEEELIGKLEMIQRMKSESNILELKSAEKGCPGCIVCYNSASL